MKITISKRLTGLLLVVAGSALWSYTKTTNDIAPLLLATFGFVLVFSKEDSQ